MIRGGGGGDPSIGLMWQATQVMPGSIWLELNVPMVHVVPLEHIGGMSKGFTPASPSQLPFGIPFITQVDITSISWIVASGLGIGGIGFSDFTILSTASSAYVFVGVTFECATRSSWVSSGIGAPDTGGLA